MKRIIIPFFCAVVFSVPALAQKTTAPTNVKAAKTTLTAQQVLDNYYQALGGKSKLENVKSIIIKGSVVIGNNEMPTITKRMGNKFKAVQTSNGRETVEVFDGENGYISNGTDRKVYGDYERQEYINGKTIDALMINKPELYTSVTSEQIDGKQYNVLTSDKSKLYFDANTNLLHKTVIAQTEFIIKNYITEGGLKFPGTTESKGIGQSLFVKNTQIILNSGVSTADFK